MLKAFVSLFVVLFCGASLAQAPRYTLQAIPPPSGFASALAVTINESSDFVASALTEDFTQVFFFWDAKSRTYTKIVGPDGENIAQVFGMNSFDSVIGITAEKAFIWTPREGAIYISPPPTYNNATPSGINDSGFVVGSVLGSDGSTAGFLWTAEKGMRISPAVRQSLAVGINNNGTIAGNAVKDQFSFRAFTADKRGARPVGILGQRSTSRAFAISGTGTVGLQYTASPGDAPQLAIWSKTFGVQLSGSGGDAYGITDKNDILGFAVSDSFLWNPDYGFANVKDLVDPSSPQVTQLYVVAAAGNRILAGQALYEGVLSAIVLTPMN